MNYIYICVYYYNCEKLQIACNGASLLKNKNKLYCAVFTDKKNQYS